MQKVAYGYLQLKPDEFWRLTMKDYILLVEGYEMREKRELERMSQLAAWIISPHCRQPIEAKMLYNPKSKETTQEESEQVVSELINQLGD
ncbi:hypothetical protein BTR23_07470 [Alkalihalophilus pseudofirmus]|nr:hypothetical protein BTR23_07470 [Alkalihalophilus pseudofirmus]